MGFAPIVLFVYNRADHFEKTVNALANCAESRDSDLFIFSDGPKDDRAAPAVKAVRKLANEIKESGRFKSVTVTESAENKGLANSVISGVSAVTEQYGRVIVLEDDCVPSMYFLKYMNECLSAFEKNERIGAISGYSPPIVLPKDYKADLFTAYRSCSWGWATWKDRWDGVDWELNSFKELLFDRDLLKRLNSNGSDRFIRLYRQTKSNRNSWSVKFGYHLVRKDMLTVYPKYSYVDNIGCDSTGVHSKTGDGEKTAVELSKALSEPVIRFISPDERIQKRMKKFYSDGFFSDIKRAVATRAIILKERSKR